MVRSSGRPHRRETNPPLGAETLAALPPSLAGGYEQVLDGTDIELRHVENRYRVLGKGDGPAVVLLHGTRDPSPLWVPLLASARGANLMAPDRPQALGRDQAVAWVGDFLDTVGLGSATIVGHSAGGLWALWFALAHPERVDHLAVIGTPALPGTVVPLPFRLVATPGLGALVVRQRATRSGAQRFAGMMGEGDTIDRYPELVDFLVAVGNDRPSVAAGRAEARQLIAPWGLLRRTAFRPVIGAAELATVRVPTTVIWGTRDPVGDAATAEAITSMIPGATLETFDAGHVPWFGHPDAMADLVTDLAPGTGKRPG